MTRNIPGQPGGGRTGEDDGHQHPPPPPPPPPAYSGKIAITLTCANIVGFKYHKPKLGHLIPEPILKVKVSEKNTFILIKVSSVHNWFENSFTNLGFPFKILKCADFAMPSMADSNNSNLTVMIFKRSPLVMKDSCFQQIV